MTVKMLLMKCLIVRFSFRVIQVFAKIADNPILQNRQEKQVGRQPTIHTFKNPLPHG